jgi:hypothetical protein
MKRELVKKTVKDVIFERMDKTDSEMKQVLNLLKSVLIQKPEVEIPVDKTPKATFNPEMLAKRAKLKASLEEERIIKELREENLRLKAETTKSSMVNGMVFTTRTTKYDNPMIHIIGKSGKPLFLNQEHANAVIVLHEQIKQWLIDNPKVIKPKKVK